ARHDVESLLAQYDSERGKIVDIYRAKALRAVAEAYQAIGDAAAALAVYKRAVDEGVVNPNSRPRAADVCATRRSLPVHRAEPDAERVKRLKAVRDGLGDPW